MELKTPAPLGERKLSEDDVTSKFLKIAEEKTKKRLKLPKISLTFLNQFRRSKLKETTEQILSEEEKQQAWSGSLKTVLSNRVIPYIKKHKERVVNISLIAVPLLLLLILFLVISAFMKSEPYRISEEFIQKIEARDISGAYQLTTDAYRAVVSEKEFSDTVNKLNSVDISNAKIKRRSINSKNQMGQYADIRYKVSGYYLDIVLFNDTTDWGILSTEISLVK